MKSLKIYHRKKIKNIDSLIDIKSRLKNSAAIYRVNLTLENSFTTTGSGPDELIQRTIARDIRIDYTRGPIGQGRFGVVFLGQWKSDKVAIKMVFSMHEPSWSRETEIYQTCLLRHDNILGFIAADIKTIRDSVNLIIITDYHPLGSLYDYLQTNTLDEKILFKFLYSISNGLNHLHQEIVGTKFKPSIAHRDLKTKNILVKVNLQCCLADFGLAIKMKNETNQIDYGNYLNNGINPQEGSVRYMAPECLDKSIDIYNIEDFKKADIYSFALIVWETLTRLKIHDQEIENHRLPYSDYILLDPSIDLMREIVSVRKLRPSTQFKHLIPNNNQVRFFIFI